MDWALCVVHGSTIDKVLMHEARLVVALSCRSDFLYPSKDRQKPQYNVYTLQDIDYHRGTIPLPSDIQIHLDFNYHPSIYIVTDDHAAQPNRMESYIRRRVYRDSMRIIIFYCMFLIGFS